MEIQNYKRINKWHYGIYAGTWIDHHPSRSSSHAWRLRSRKRILRTWFISSLTSCVRRFPHAFPSKHRLRSTLIQLSYFPHGCVTSRSYPHQVQINVFVVEFVFRSLLTALDQLATLGGRVLHWATLKEKSHWSLSVAWKTHSQRQQESQKMSSFFAD